MATKDLKEKLEVGGGATGTSYVPDPVGGTATLPNSKKQGEGMNKAQSITPGQSIDECDPETNTSPTGDMSAQNKASVAMKTSAGVQEHVEAMFQDEQLTEEFKEKATVIFEAAIAAKTEEIAAQLEEEYAERFEDAKNDIYEEITTQVDEYLDYVVEQWMKENEVAIESSLRAEIVENFITGLKGLFEEHYIDVPETETDVLGELAARVEELEAKLNETISENIDLKGQIEESQKDKLISAVAEGLVATQVEKFKSLAEGVDFDDAETYVRKLEIVKENYFPSDKKAAVLDQEEEESLSEGYEGKVSAGPVSNYVKAISRTIKR